MVEVRMVVGGCADQYLMDDVFFQSVKTILLSRHALNG
jgi:hypothetical protein